MERKVSVRESWRENRETQRKTLDMSLYLFKLFHGEHLLGELEYQVLPHCAAKHLVKETERHM